MDYKQLRVVEELPCNLKFMTIDEVLEFRDQEVLHERYYLLKEKLVDLMKAIKYYSNVENLQLHSYQEYLTSKEFNKKVFYHDLTPGQTVAIFDQFNNRKSECSICKLPYSMTSTGYCFFCTDLGYLGNETQFKFSYVGYVTQFADNKLDPATWEGVLQDNHAFFYLWFDNNIVAERGIHNFHRIMQEYNHDVLRNLVLTGPFKVHTS